MKRRLPLFLLTLFLIIGNQAFANHLLGGEITYKFVSASGNNQVYRVKLSFFADCSSDVPDGAFRALLNANPYIKLYKDNNLVEGRNLRYNAAESDIEITPVCPDEATNTTCFNINNPLPGIKKYVYEGEFTLNGTHNNWRFAFEGSISSNSQAGRSLIIDNVEIFNSTTGVTSLMYLEATLNNTSATNSSPAFTAPPTPFFCINKAQTYSLGAADPDNDNMGFSLITAKQLPNINTGIVNPVTYLGTYTATAPLPTAPGNFNFNSTNGQLNFTPNMVQNCLVVNLVEEFRNGVKIGSSMREMTFVILDNCANDAPVARVSNVSNADSINDNGNLILEVCEGHSDTISFDISSVDTNADNINVTYQNLPEGATLTINSNSTPTPGLHFEWNAEFAAPGNYIFYITYTDDGCPLVSTQTIAYTIRITPYDVLFEQGAVASCSDLKNGKVWVIPNHDNRMHSYTWRDEEGNVLQESSGTAGDTLKNIGSGTYTVAIRNDDGCGTNITITTPEPIPLPQISLPNDTTLCKGMPYNISIEQQDAVSYLWSNGSTECCIKVTEAGVYTLTATNACGTVSEQINIATVPCNFCLFVPNAFSPNGDGSNDVFRILETCPIKKFQLQIFNRWGERVFTSLSSSIRWDGTYKGKAAESGTYFYSIEATPEDAAKGTIELNGDITLIR
jgi:gliding motility-associated-like protein